MANTETQNCQRGTIFLTFLSVLFFCIFNIINCVKKRIDPIQAEGENASKYKEGEAKEGEVKAGQKKRQKTEEAIKEKPAKRQKQEEDSTTHFDGAAIAMKAQQVQEEDQPVIKVLKKNEQFQLIYFPFFLIFILNILTGTSKAFSLVNYLFTLIIVLIFNVIKWHRKCANHICLNLVFDNLWIVMLFFGLLNQWAAYPIAQPYIVLGT